MPGGRADTRLQGRLGHAVHLEVHIGKTGRPTGKHLQNGRQGPPVDVVGRQFFLDGPDLLLQPFHQGRFLAEPPQKRHGRMGVRVDEAGQHSHPPMPGHDLVCPRRRLADAQDLGNPSLGDEQVPTLRPLPSPVQHQHILEQRRHLECLLYRQIHPKRCSLLIHFQIIRRQGGFCEPK